LRLYAKRGSAAFLAATERSRHAARAAGHDTDAVDVRRRYELRAALQRLGDVAHVRRALRPCGATEAADALPVARRRVALERAVGVAEVLGAARDDARDAAEVQRIGGCYFEHRLDALVERREPLRGEHARKALFLTPRSQRGLGGAVARARVHDG